MSSTIGFIGVGNMGGALARAACRWNAQQVVITSRSLQKVQELKDQLGCRMAQDNQALAAGAKFIVLGVKPHQMGQLLQELAPVLKQRRDRYILVSMAAGVTLATLASQLGMEAPILRIMPNTPSSIGKGMILYTPNQLVQPEEVEEFCQIMATAGRLDALEESQMDAASALAGCGPAFAYLFLEALADGAVACGLPRAKAMEYAAQTLAGAADMVLETGSHPGQLKDAVCSPGGSTIQGVRALEERGMRAAAMNAVIVSYEKNKELGKQ